MVTAPTPPPSFALLDDAVLDGEDLGTTDLETALRWVSVYAELLRTALVLRSRAQPSSETLRQQADMYGRRLLLWKARASEIAERFP
jgi:hypothetical protein